jgi:leucyl aminopeptidase
MHTPLTVAPLDLVSMPPADLDVDWLVLPWLEGEPDEGLAEFDRATGGQLFAARASGEWKGKRFDLLVLPVLDGAFRARRIALVGAGALSDYTPDVARRVAATAALQVRDRKAVRIAVVHRTALGCPAGNSVPESEWVQALAEGATLAGFDGGRYKSGPDGRGVVDASIVVAPGTAASVDALKAAAWRGSQIAHCANLARELVNEPGNQLPPRVLAERARELAAGTTLDVEVLDEHAIQGLGMGLLSAVGQGSREPPRLIVLTHDPERMHGGSRHDEPGGVRHELPPVLGLVGKGVTFDSGGISIKSAEGMERMKDDMAGGAAVVAAMRAISLLEVPLRVIGVVPSAENMPGGGAVRPGDVVRGASGRTVEVVNTDAEGRLVLADGLWFAKERGATHLVDIGTLTGACTVALGKLTAGVFGRPDEWRDAVLQAARRSGEACWPMPLVEEERDQLESEIADTTNSGNRYGGAITAALFVGEFAGDTPWAHLDIAGPAWLSEGKRYAGKGATGFGVRTLVALAEALSATGVV